MGTPLTSCIYDCEVVHKRLIPKRHEFRYRLFFVDIDLEEIPSLVKARKFLSHNRLNLYSIDDRDHIDLGAKGLRGNLSVWMDEQGFRLASTDTVRLLTLPRVLGYLFNPVCFYYVFSETGEPRCVVVEVCNTFKELKPYLVSDSSENGCFRLQTPKNFYVSPFSALDAEFDFRVRFPDEKVEIHIDNIENQQTSLVSWIRGDRKELTDLRLAWYCVRFPFLTLGVIFRIHYQAMILWFRKIPFYRKIDNPELQTNLYRPHSKTGKTP